MNILFLSPRPCDPPNSGAKLREYHLARQLSASANVDLLAFHTGAKVYPEFCRYAESFPRPARYTPAKIIEGLLSGQPLSLLNYFSPEMAAAVARLVARTTYDVIMVESVHMASYRHILAAASGQPLIVYDWHNIESELLDRFADKSSNLLKKFYARHTARQLRMLEGELCKSTAAHIVCSERERVEVLKAFPSARVEVVRNGVDLDAFSSPASQSGRSRILFVGAMDYYPNIVAAVFFASKIWPALHAAHPELSFTIAGANPVPAVRELANLPGVVVTGTVASVVHYYQEAAVVVVPLLEGAGTRLKIIEAMAAGVPVVSTPIGAEGIPVEDEAHLLLRDPAGDWTGAISGLLADPARAAMLVDNAHNFVANHYTWQSIGRGFLNALENWRKA